MTISLVYKELPNGLFMFIPFLYRMRQTKVIEEIPRSIHGIVHTNSIINSVRDVEAQTPMNFRSLPYFCITFSKATIEVLKYEKRRNENVQFI